MSRNQAYSLPEKWGGRDYLMPIDFQVVRYQTSYGGDSIFLEFTSAEYSEKAQGVYDTLELEELSFLIVWDVYNAMKEQLCT
jgi:hypothetical protein